MPRKHQLHQLLQEDQEPFRLRDYIADRRTNVKPSSNQLQLRKTSSAQHFPVTLCKNACFNGGRDSPDLVKSSPVFHFPKSPVKIIQIPSKTAALLLEAALRIHNHSSRKHSQRFFGSVLKKLTVKPQKRSNIGLDNILPSRKSASGKRKLKRDSIDSEEILSDSASDKSSLDTLTSCSSSSSNSAATRLCCRSPDFSPPPSSPSRCTVKNADEEEKEQCSPVCVLDPLSEDDDNRDEDEEEEEGGYGRVQRTKQQLLHKLNRFEKLADLSKKELERIILEDEHEENDDIADEFLQQVLEKCGFQDIRRTPIDVKILVSDLIAEEEMKHDVVNSVCAKLESWEEVERNTIDMMVDRDFKHDSWKKNQEQVTMVSTDIELAIFTSLVGELLCEFSNPHSR